MGYPHIRGTVVAAEWQPSFIHLWPGIGCPDFLRPFEDTPPPSAIVIQMPKVTPHVCRHTFCSNMAKSGMNPKTLQYIMGHADISVTLNTYTHVNFDDAKEEVYRIANS